MTWLVPDFWHALTIPALREFSCYGGGENFLYSNFISLVARSPCLLQRLSLHNYQTTDSHFAELLRAVPSLVNLSLKEVGITNETLRMLNLSDANVTHSLLPNLQAFRWSGSRHDFNLDFSVLANFLHSRWDNRKLATSDHDSESSGIARLQSFKFETNECGVPDAHISAKLEQFAAEGLNIALATADGCWPRSCVKSIHRRAACIYHS